LTALAPGEQAGHWFRLRRAAPMTIRVAFLKVAGREELIGQTAGREVEVHLDRSAEGWIGITVWFRTADQFAAFLQKAGLQNAIHPGMLPAIGQALPARHTRGHGRSRNRRHEPGTVARVLAVHYLSTEGGGTRSLEDAAELYRRELERAAETNRTAGYPPPDGWQALGDNWRSERSRVLAELTEELGPL
jgi:hypothetical protein